MNGKNAQSDKTAKVSFQPEIKISDFHDVSFAWQNL
jgi:hypothetical protein